VSDQHSPAMPTLLATPLMKADEVADLLRVSRDTIFELARRQTDPLPSVKVGRARRFIRARVEAWLVAQAP
jgi:excisionase family DNA binding protein